ncbi:MAG: carboxylesterase family protein, partial [Planctomycetota bacterium]
MNTRRGVGLAVTVVLFALARPCTPVAAQEQGVTDGSFLTEALLLDPVGRRRRAAVSRDALQPQLLGGDWAPPRAGDRVPMPDGEERVWRTATAGDDGWIADRALRGGYAHFTVEVPQRRVALLEARGHSMVYVNGEPRVGDPYNTGFVRLPILLEPGVNSLLFQVSRGRVQARLAEPTSRVMLDARDRTVPDLIVGEPVVLWAAVVVINAGVEAVRELRLEATHPVHGTTSTRLPPIAPLTVRKVGFRIEGPMPQTPGEYPLTLTLVDLQDDLTQIVHDELELELSSRAPSDLHKRTFRSDIDGSVQYYAVRPPTEQASRDELPAMVLSLHGAGVEARRQASSYRARPWCYVVAPTNRRPFGFDWEDWGRLDALEVLGLAEGRYSTDPARTYLTGHSMGGHGTWNLGVQFPDRFAAIAPSAGWISFWSYTGAARYDEGGPIEQILTRASSPSDTLGLSRNYLQQGIYVLHGDRDDNVPVGQARIMREHLGGFHSNFAYYERPGAGHWWGNQCMDWPPLFAFLQENRVPVAADVRRV